MNAPPVYVLGTPGGSWLMWASARMGSGAKMLSLAPVTCDKIALQIGDGVAEPEPIQLDVDEFQTWLPTPGGLDRSVGISSQGIWVAGALASAVADAKFVVFVESPSLALASDLDAGRVLDPEVWLTHWCAGARQALRLVQQWRSRVFLIELEEAQIRPEALDSVLISRTGLAWHAQPVPALHQLCDPLCVALGQLLAGSRIDLRLLYDELLASCELLVPDSHEQSQIANKRRLDGAGVVQTLYALRRASQELTASPRRMSTDQGRIDQLQVQQGAADTPLAQLSMTPPPTHAADDVESGDQSDQVRALSGGLQNSFDGSLPVADGDLHRRCLALSGGWADLKNFETEHVNQSLATEAISQETASLNAEATPLQPPLNQLRQAGVLSQSHAGAEIQALQHALRTALQEGRTAQQQDVAKLVMQDAMSREANAVLLQLHDVQEALEQRERLGLHDAQQNVTLRLQTERLALAQDDAMAQLRAAEHLHRVTQAALVAAQTEITSLRHDLALSRQGNVEIETQKAVLQAEAAALVKEIAVLRRDLAKRNKEVVAQGLQVTQALGKVDRLSTELGREQACLRLLRVPGEVTFDEVKFQAPRQEPPFHELTASLRGVKSRSRVVHEATVRLVEHHGHPGLAIFADKGAEPLLECWFDSGRENGRPYLLLVPSDSKSESAFASMNSDDWHLTLAIALRLERELLVSQEAMHRRWHGLAKRLAGQLHGLPRRFRYATLEAELIADDGVIGLAFTLGRVHYGSHELERLSLSWRLAGPGAGISLLYGSCGEPPLQSWPDDERSAVPLHVVVPVGHPVAEAEKRCWQRLPAADRDFVAALLSVWPQIVASLPAAIAQSAGGSQTLQAVAVSLRSEAMLQLPTSVVACLQPPAEGMLRRAVRRVRRRTSMAV